MEDKKNIDYFKNPKMEKKTAYTDEYGFRLDHMPVGMDYFENPNIEKKTAYTDEYGFRLGSFIDDKDRGRGR